MAPSRPITHRPLDLLYQIFFLTHIPIILLVDAYPLYPAAIHSALPFLTSIRSFYVDRFRDRLFTHPPAWFGVFCWMEVLLHLPVAFWAVRGLARDSNKTPLILLPYAVQTAVTTLTCIAEALSWDDFSTGEKWALMQLYVPYLLLSVVMGADMFRRLGRVLDGWEAKKRV